MTAIRHVAVIDIGKTNAKLALVDLETRGETEALRRPNRPCTDGPYPHHDVEGIWRFILDGLADLARRHPIDAVSVTTHGATAALIDGQGGLALPVLDYEFDGPDTLRSAYEAIRPPFTASGSPPLPLGLNLGAQLFWLERTFSEAFARTTAILAYPQYWAWRLTGVTASEATSLGCHTDLWNPHAGRFSSLVEARGWRSLFPALRQAGNVLGPILPAIAARTGLTPATPVVCGIHDSNASLLPHLIDRKPPFAVVSTGTWVVAMAPGACPPALDPGRDTLVNVDALGNSVPSARFMGGREFEQVMAGRAQRWDDGDRAAVTGEPIMLLPSVVAGTGPFPRHGARWIGGEPEGGRRFVAASFYLALMTATCLELVGAAGDVVVEGPFAANGLFLAMLEAATGRPVEASGSSTGTSIGAALLVGVPRRLAPAGRTASQHLPDGSLAAYAKAWRAEMLASA